MNTPSIENIKKRRTEIKESLKRVRTHNFSNARFGAESEFTDKSVIAGIESVILDADALCSAPSRFIKNSTGQERATISSLFDQLLNHANNLDLASAVNVLDQIKPIFRSLGIRSSDERRVTFENHIDDLQRKSISLASEIENLKQIKSTTENELQQMAAALEKAENQIENINSISSSINSSLELAENTKSMIEDIKNHCTNHLEGIESLYNEAEAAKAPIDEFSKKIAQREIQIENQEAKTNEYLRKLKEYSTERSEILSYANQLIESARAALGYTTAQGLSAAFTEKYIEAKSDKSTWVWIGVSALFVIIAILIGIWVTIDSDKAIGLLIGRISLIPILLAGAWFSASQYIKQRNIAEEYAYKSVLVRSMVGFSEQIASGDGKGEDHSHYVRNVLAEIHMNPLHKQSDKNKEIKKNEIIDIIKEITGPLEKIADRTLPK
jgi:hypothetical protein